MEVGPILSEPVNSCRLVMPPESVLQITLEELAPACPLLRMLLGQLGF